MLDKFEKKLTGQKAVRAGTRFTLFISNKAMDDIIKIVESLEKSGLLIDGASKTVKYEIKIKKKESWFLSAMMGPPTTSSLIQSIAFSLINSLTRKEQEGVFLSLLALPLMKKKLGKGVRRAGRGYMNKNF